MRAILKMMAVAGGFMLISNSQPAMASKTTYPSSLDMPANFLAMKVSDFIKLSAKDFSTITAKKLNLKERIAFSLMKKSMKKSLKSHSDQTVKDYLATADKKDNTTLIIILVVLVVVVAAVVIASINSIDVGLSGGW